MTTTAIDRSEALENDPTPECPCSWSSKTYHGDMLNMETSALALSQLIHVVATWDEQDLSEWPMPIDLPDFMAEHNWLNPPQMRMLADNLVHLYRRAAAADTMRVSIESARLCLAKSVHPYDAR